MPFKPKEDEITAVDDFFEIPGFPSPTIAEKRWALKCLDRLIAVTQFRTDGFANEDDDSPPMRKWKVRNRMHWRKRLASYKWMHLIIDKMTCVEHKNIEVTD